MPFTMVTCDACSQLVEHSCYNSGLEYEKSKSHFGSHIYKFSINSFPSDCDPHSLVSLAWSKMPGNSYGNTNVCDHAKAIWRPSVDLKLLHYLDSHDLISFGSCVLAILATASFA
ncbi:hypothetical protein C2857_007196 [Epichloe festucae Fl1]|uniref:Uncharacterized protein n=1 Tax=Epichloe festucae (strain Fl1) TaxID=877507 RepID=A0A7S9PUD5_EPIFF|nr:hypothetical protein C2857_007196 [Epichloe festucae Fl1]